MSSTTDGALLADAHHPPALLGDVETGVALPPREVDRRLELGDDRGRDDGSATAGVGVVVAAAADGPPARSIADDVERSPASSPPGSAVLDAGRDVPGGASMSG